MSSVDAITEDLLSRRVAAVNALTGNNIIEACFHSGRVWGWAHGKGLSLSADLTVLEEEIKQHDPSLVEEISPILLPSTADLESSSIVQGLWKQTVALRVDVWIGQVAVFQASRQSDACRRQVLEALVDLPQLGELLLAGVHSRCDSIVSVSSVVQGRANSVTTVSTVSDAPDREESITLGPDGDADDGWCRKSISASSVSSASIRDDLSDDAGEGYGVVFEGMTQSQADDLRGLDADLDKAIQDLPTIPSSSSPVPKKPSCAPPPAPHLIPGGPTAAAEASTNSPTGQEDPIAKKQAARERAVFEVLTTERSFVHQLNMLIEAVLEPLEAASKNIQPILTPAEIRIVFSDIRIIRDVNKVLLELLEARMVNWHDEQKLGDIFLQLYSYLKMYTAYVKNFSVALRTIKELQVEKKPLRDFLANVRPACQNLDISSLLVTPIQRIPRYSLLLAEIVRFTDPDHVDYADLTAALEQLQSVASYVNEKQREAENIAQVTAIQAAFTPPLDDLAAAHRRFIREGVCGGDGTRLAFLFNDKLLLAKKKRKLLKFAQKKQLSLVADLPLLDMRLVDGGEANSVMEIQIKKKFYTLSFSSVEERRSWWDELTQCISACKEIYESIHGETKRVAETKSKDYKALLELSVKSQRSRNKTAAERVAKGRSADLRAGTMATNSYTMKTLTSDELKKMAQAAQLQLQELVETEKRRDISRVLASHVASTNLQAKHGARHAGMSGMPGASGSVSPRSGAVTPPSDVERGSNASGASTPPPGVPELPTMFHSELQNRLKKRSESSTQLP